MLRRVLTIALVSILLLLALQVAPALSRLPARPFPAGCRPTAVRVDEASVPAELCRDNRPGKEPGLVILHGCGGFGGVDRRLAERFPHEGIATLDLDYFALTPPPGRRGFCTARTVPRRILAVWRTIVLTAGAELGSRSGVDPRRIGVVGWSMGADLALGAAASSQAFVVVVAYSPDDVAALAKRAARFPPTLILMSRHGDVRAIGAVKTLLRALHAAHVTATLFVYPTGSHYWEGRQGQEGFAEAVAFLHHRSL